MIKFAAISPHAPILMPGTGSPEDHQKLRKTLYALKTLAQDFKKAEIDEIIISSPHQDWGFNVPLFLIAKNFKGEITPILTGFESPHEHFKLGQNFASRLNPNKNYAVIASGDLSHRLQEDGPYGFHPDGPKFDQELIKVILKVRTNEKYNFPPLFDLEEKYPEAADCGLRSFAFALGVLEKTKTKINPKILSYEGPYGVGYLVAKLV